MGLAAWFYCHSHHFFVIRTIFLAFALALFEMWHCCLVSVAFAPALFEMWQAAWFLWALFQMWHSRLVFVAFTLVHFETSSLVSVGAILNVALLHSWLSSILCLFNHSFFFAHLHHCSFNSLSLKKKHGPQENSKCARSGSNKIWPSKNDDKQATTTM